MQLETGTKVYHSPSVQSMIHRTYSTPHFDLLRSVILSASFIWALALSWIPLYNTYPTPSYHPTYTHTYYSKPCWCHIPHITLHNSHSQHLPIRSALTSSSITLPFWMIPIIHPPTPHTCFHCIVYWLTQTHTHPCIMWLISQFSSSSSSLNC